MLALAAALVGAERRRSTCSAGADARSPLAGALAATAQLGVPAAVASLGLADARALVRDRDGDRRLGARQPRRLHARRRDAGSRRAARHRAAAPGSSAPAAAESSAGAAPARPRSAAAATPGGGVGVGRVERLGRRAARGRALSSWSRCSLSSSVTSLVGVLDEPAHLLVDAAAGCASEVSLTPGQERPCAVARQHRDRPDRLAHAPAADHLARDLRSAAGCRTRRRS